MIAPDGTPGDVPQARVPDASKAGFKVAADLISPDGRTGIVPIDRVHEAINAGFRLQGVGPSAPQVDMQEEAISSKAPAGKLSGLPGVNPHTPTPGEAIGDVALAAGPLAAIPVGGAAEAVAPAARAVSGAIAKHPIMSMAALAAAKKIPGIGPYLEHIPDWLPLLAGGKGAAAEAAPTAEAEGVAAAKAAPALTGAPIYRDATLNKRNIPEYAGEAEASAAKPAVASQVIKTLNQAEALRQPTHDVVDAAIPPTGPTQAANVLTKARVDYHLQKGDVDAAQAVLESATPKAAAVNKFPPEAPKIVPSVQNIRENDAMIRAAEARPGPKLDAMEDRALQQEMNWNLEKHGYRAESEARREFIARNSTGMTKGELAKRFNAQKPPAAEEDLTEILRKSLEQVQGKKQ